MAIPASQQQDVRVRLGPVNAQSSDQDLWFNLNPSRIQREYDAQYVPIPIAQADWAPTGNASNIPPPVVWARNNPERINLEFRLVDEKTLALAGVSGINANGARDDIEAEIKKLEDYRYKNPQTGQPPDLVFSVGNAHDRVRIERMMIDPKIWTKGLYRQQAEVTMTLIVVRPRSQ